MKISGRSSLASVVAIASVLVACGGGGDGGSQSNGTKPTLALTTANRDLVSHDAAGAVVSLGTLSMSLGGSPASAGSGMRVQRYGMASSWPGRMAGMTLDRLQAAMPAAGRRQALAVTPPMVEPCLVSGSTTTTVDDRDNNGDVSAGDSGTVVFNACMDTATETVHGTTSLVFSDVDANSLTVHATMSGMSTVTAGHSLTVDGSVQLKISSSDGVHATIRTTAEGVVQAAISTHVPFSDTVALQDGFVIEETVDASLAPPAGAGTTPGRTLTTLSGRMHSSAAGGTFDVAIGVDAPLTRYLAEPYPRAGVIRATGATGVLVLTTPSMGSVVLDLDGNDDGVVETSETKTWEWLL